MDTDLRDALRREVRAFVTRSGTVRRPPATSHVGWPGGEQVLVPEVDGPGPLSGAAAREAQALAADLVERAIDGLLTTGPACAWLCRPGPLGRGDLETRWHAAAREGFARHGLGLAACVVVNRTGWLDLVGGEQREWSRLRPGPVTAPPAGTAPWTPPWTST